MTIRAVILDLDGTVYNDDELVPGADRFVRLLAERNIRRLFVTNRANRTPQAIRGQLRGYGLACEPEDILTAAEATARYLKPGTAYCIGEEGLTIAMREAGFTLTDRAPDYVVVSYDRGFTYEKLRIATRLIAGGAAFIATNPDKGLKTAEGIMPGTGAIVAAVETATGVKPLYIGKPETRIIEMGLKRLGVAAEETLVVGDNVETDIPAGSGVGARTALILTGISRREEAERASIGPTWIVEDYQALSDIVLTVG